MRKLFLIAFVGILLYACATDGQTEEQNKLVGRWELKSAQRAAKSTDSLRGLYFEFTGDKVLRTNIMNGVAEEGTWEQEENSIAQRNTSRDIDYTIESLTDSMLVLNTKLSETNFRFVLGKKIEKVLE